MPMYCFYPVFITYIFMSLLLSLFLFYITSPSPMNEIKKIKEQLFTKNKRKGHYLMCLAVSVFIVLYFRPWSRCDGRIPDKNICKNCPLPYNCR